MKKSKILFSSLILLSLLVWLFLENTNENLVKDRGVVVLEFNLEPAFYTTDFENTFIEFDVDLPEAETREAELYALLMVRPH